MVIRGGENVYPREIEEFLYAHPDVADVQVIGVPDERYGEELCAFVSCATARPGDARGAAGVLPRAHRALQGPALRADRVVVPDDRHGQGAEKFKLREQAIEELDLSGHLVGQWPRRRRIGCHRGRLRAHPAVRLGSSVRGAIDMVRLADGLARLRAERPLGRDGLLDAAVASMSGPRARARGPGPQRRGGDRRAARPGPQPAPRRAGGGKDRRPAAPPPGGRRGALSPAETRRRVADQRRQTLSRDRLAAAHAQFAAVSPQVGRLDEAAFTAALARDADVAVALLADLAAATDPRLRAEARRLAGRLLPRLGRVGRPRRRGTRRLVARRAALEGDLDVDRTLDPPQAPARATRATSWPASWRRRRGPSACWWTAAGR